MERSGKISRTRKNTSYKTTTPLNKKNIRRSARIRKLRSMETNSKSLEGNEKTPPNYQNTTSEGETDDENDDNAAPPLPGSRCSTKTANGGPQVTSSSSLVESPEWENASNNLQQPWRTHGTTVPNNKQEHDDESDDDDDYSVGIVSGIADIRARQEGTATATATSTTAARGRGRLRKGAKPSIAGKQTMNTTEAAALGASLFAKRKADGNAQAQSQQLRDPIATLGDDDFESDDEDGAAKQMTTLPSARARPGFLSDLATGGQQSASAFSVKRSVDENAQQQKEKVRRPIITTWAKTQQQIGDDDVIANPRLQQQRAGTAKRTTTLQSDRAGPGTHGTLLASSSSLSIKRSVDENAQAQLQQLRRSFGTTGDVDDGAAEEKATLPSACDRIALPCGGRQTTMSTLAAPASSASLSSQSPVDGHAQGQLEQQRRAIATTWENIEKPISNDDDDDDDGVDCNSGNAASCQMPGRKALSATNNGDDGAGDQHTFTVVDISDIKNQGDLLSEYAETLLANNQATRDSGKIPTKKLTLRAAAAITYLGTGNEGSSLKSTAVAASSPSLAAIKKPVKTATESLSSDHSLKLSKGRSLTKKKTIGDCGANDVDYVKQLEEVTQQQQKQLQEIHAKQQEQQEQLKEKQRKQLQKLYDQHQKVQNQLLMKVERQRQQQQKQKQVKQQPNGTVGANVTNSKLPQPPPTPPTTTTTTRTTSAGKTLPKTSQPVGEKMPLALPIVSQAPVATASKVRRPKVSRSPPIASQEAATATASQVPRPLLQDEMICSPVEISPTPASQKNPVTPENNQQQQKPIQLKMNPSKKSLKIIFSDVESSDEDVATSSPLPVGTTITTLKDGRSLRKVSSIEKWSILSPPKCEPKAPTFSYLKFPLIKLAKAVHDIQLPSDLWYSQVLDNLKQNWKRQNGQPASVIFRRKVKEQSSLPYDREIVFEEKCFNVFIEGKHVELLGAPDTICNFVETEQLIDIVDHLSLQSSCVQCLDEPNQL